MCVKVRVVDGINGPIVVESLGTKQLVKLHNSAIKIVISGLAESTYYRATLVVHSGVGDSKASAFLFVTASDRSSRRWICSNRLGVCHYLNNIDLSTLTFQHISKTVVFARRSVYNLLRFFLFSTYLLCGFSKLTI